MQKNTTVWIWNSSGELLKGVFVGAENGWLKIDIGDYVLFKKQNQIFKDEETAKAWQLVKRVKRLLHNGIPMEDIIYTDDKEAFDKAVELFPEELI